MSNINNNYQQQTSYNAKNLSCVHLISPIKCDIATQFMRQYPSNIDFATDKGLILRITGYVTYQKVGILITTTPTKYFVPYENIAGISNYVNTQRAKKDNNSKN